MTLFLGVDDRDVLLCRDVLEDGGLGGGLAAGLRGSLGDGVEIVGRESNDMAPSKRPGDPEVLPVSLPVSASMLTFSERETPGATATSAERETLRSAANCHMSGLQQESAISGRQKNYKKQKFM